MPKYELTDELRKALGPNQRETMACRHAKFLLERVPHNRCFLPEAPLPQSFNWKAEVSMWEIEIGGRLADLLRPVYKKEQAVMAKVRAKQEKAEADKKAIEKVIEEDPNPGEGAIVMEIK